MYSFLFVELYFKDSNSVLSIYKGICVTFEINVKKKKKEEDRRNLYVSKKREKKEILSRKLIRKIEKIVALKSLFYSFRYLNRLPRYRLVQRL